MEKSADTVSAYKIALQGRYFHFITEAISETLPKLGLRRCGQYIRKRAALQQARYCIVREGVLYLSVLRGTSLATQLENNIPELKRYKEKIAICMPFDDMVYFCSYTRGLVSAEQFLTADYAQREIRKSKNKIVVFPVGSLAGQFREKGRCLPVDRFRFDSSWRNPDTFESLSFHLFRYGLLSPKYAAFALAVCFVAAALFAGRALPRLEDPGEIAGQLQSIAVPETLPATAGTTLRKINAVMGKVARATGVLAVKRLEFKQDTLSLFLDKKEYWGMERAFASALGFTPKPRAESLVLALPVEKDAAPTSSPPDYDEFEQRLAMLKKTDGVHSVRFDSHHSLGLAVHDLHVDMGGITLFSLRHLAGFFDDMPFELRVARIVYNDKGLPERATLNLKARTLKL